MDQNFQQTFLNVTVSISFEKFQCLIYNLTTCESEVRSLNICVTLGFWIICGYAWPTFFPDLIQKISFEHKNINYIIN